MNTLLSVIFMTWMTRNLDDAPEAGGSLMVAAIQTSILLGAVIGGVVAVSFLPTSASRAEQAARAGVEYALTRLSE
ncbi:MAG TPA: MFS transporter, partial [Paracoccus sp. (in: a-proteobacteria)]|nr:MFS transporter [Paracoccus sp. (in: a-proteobacteria)]